MTAALQTKPITLHSLGACSIQTHTGDITPSSDMLFAVALYLILERDKRTNKEKLCRLLWPLNKSISKTRPRLRQLLHKLRHHGFPIPHSEDIRLPVNFATTDYEALITGTKKLDYSMTANGDVRFLPEYDPTFSRPLKIWITQKREIIHQNLAPQILKLVSTARNSGNWEQAKLLASRCLELQPDNEEAICVIAECKSMLGDKRGALRMLNRHAKQHDKHFAKLPSRALLHRITDGPTETPYTTIRRSPLVGRTEAIKLLTPFVNRIKNGNANAGSGFFLCGEAGIGKSRLATEVEQHATLAGLHIESVKCQPGDEHTPLSIFMNLVPRLQKLPGAAGCKEETIKSLRRITSHDPEAKQIQDSGEAEIVRAQIRIAVMDLIDAVVEEQPLVLIVEDIHWLDKASAKLLQDLATWGHNRQLGILLTSRKGYTECTGLPVTTAISTYTLTRLSDAETRQLALNIVSAHGKTMDEEYIDRVSLLSEGNPFFLHELIKHWVDTGEQHVTVSPSLKLVLQERIDRLTPKALHTLQAVAFLGKHSTLERLSYVLGCGWRELVTTFDELSNAEMLRSDDNNLIHSWHDLYADEAIAKLSPLGKKMLHRQVGGVLERYVKGAESTSILWDCAEHFKEAGEIDKAKWTTLSCARHLTELGYQKDAAEAYERVLSYCTNDKDKLVVLQELAQAQAGAALWTPLRHTTSACQKIIRTDKNATAHNDIELLEIFSIWRSLGANEALVAHLQKCVVDGEASDQHKIKAALAAIKIASEMGLREIVATTYKMAKSHIAFTKVDETLTIEMEMIHETVCGDMQQAANLVKKYLTIPKREDVTGLEKHRTVNCITILRWAGEFELAISVARETLEFMEKYSLDKPITLIASGLIYTYLSMEDTKSAWGVYEDHLLKREQILKDELFAHKFVHELKARIILVDAEATGDHSMFTQYDEGTDKFYSFPGIAKMEHLSIYVHRRILEKAPPASMRDAVLEMLDIHKTLRANGGQDYPTYVLVRGLRYLDEAADTDRLLCDYVDKYRRESWEVKGNLAREVQAARTVS